MKSDRKFEDAIRDLIKKDPRYPVEAYHLVRHGVNLECRRIADANPQGSPHVSGEQLAKALARLANKQFGPLALDVLKEWGINQTEDFGNIVFNLVNNKLLGVSEEDSIDDFKNVYDFDQTFRQPYMCPDPIPDDLPPIA